MEAKSRTSPLLTSYEMGKFILSHRVVLPPLTRNRAFNNKPQAHGVEYYAQRATDGGFLISEAAAATDISLRCPNMPGIWTEKQVEAWKSIVEAVHAKGGIIFCQVWHPARISNYTIAPEGSDLTKTSFNKKVGGDYHSFDTTSRGSHTTGEEGEGSNAPPSNILLAKTNVESRVANAHILFDREDVEQTVTPHDSMLQNLEDVKPSIAPHSHILFDREDVETIAAPDAYILLDREDVEPSVASHAYILFNREVAEPNVAPHAHLLLDREDAEPNVAPHPYILFDREDVEHDVAPHPYILFDREDAEPNVAPHPYILFDREDAEPDVAPPHPYILFDREDAKPVAPHAYILLDRHVATSPLSSNSEYGSVPLLIADRTESSIKTLISGDRNESPLLSSDRVSATSANDRGLNLNHKDVVSDKLSIERSTSIINDFALAARNAIKAGFDGVEINCAHGYLIERHLNNELKNNTPNPYGGSIEKRCRLALEVVEAVTNEIGRDRVGIKLAPFDDFQGLGHLSPIAAGTYLATELNKRGLLYLHVTEPRMIKIGDTFKTPRSLQPIRDAFEGTLIASGGYDKADGDDAVAGDYADLVSFGRLFVANPDLPKRFELNAPLNEHDRSTFYVPDPVLGYIDYPSLGIVS